MLPYDDLTQEEMDPQNEAIVTFLRHAYTGSLEAPPLKQIQEQAVANVLARFQDQSQTASDSSILPDAPEEEQALWSAGSSLQLSPRPRKRRFVSRLTSLIAAALLIALVSSLVAVFSIEKHAQNSGVTADPHQKTIFAVSQSGTVFAIDGKDGAVLWQKHMSGDNNSPFGGAAGLTFADGAIYTGSSVSGGYVYAFQPRDGSIIWHVHLQPDGSPLTPDVVNGVVYVAASDFTGGKSHVYALNAVNGAILWRVQLQGQEPMQMQFQGQGTGQTVVNNIMYVSTVEGNLYALNVKNGAQLWRAQTHPQIYSDIVVLNGVAYVSAVDVSAVGGYVYAIDATSGAILWHKDMNVPWGIAVSHGLVYIGGDGGYLYALRVQDGVQQWKAHVGNQGPYWAVVVNNTLYALSSYDWTIYALNAQDGQSLWSYPTGGTTVASPIIVDGVLYAARLNESMDALNASNGRLLAHYALPIDRELLEVTSIAVEP